MPTINQLIRKGRKASQNVSKSPALNRGYNSCSLNQQTNQVHKNVEFVLVLVL